MKNLVRLLAVLMFISTTCALLGTAQEKEQAKEPANNATKTTNVYKVDFVVAEMDNGKRVNTRSYTLMMEEGQQSSAKVNSRVPVVRFRPEASSSGNSPARETDYQYMNVGLSLRFRFLQQGEYLMMNGMYNLDTVVQDPVSGMPVTRQISSEISAAVLPGKPTVISSVEDTNSTKRYQLEVTATKIK